MQDSYDNLVCSLECHSAAAERGLGVVEYEVRALLEDYQRIASHIVEFQKLQYQLVGVAYAIVGATLALWGSSSTRPQSLPLLLFPSVFCGIVLVQLYLHANIKSFARYINFRLRPRMEAVINSKDVSKSEWTAIWDWEEYYVRSHQLPRFIIRQLGSVIVILPFLPAVGALILYWLLVPSPWPETEQFLVTFDSAVVSLTFAFIIFVKVINEHWWQVEKEQESQRQLMSRASSDQPFGR